mgnify:CR=1 FL=1
MTLNTVLYFQGITKPIKIIKQKQMYILKNLWFAFLLFARFQPVKTKFVFYFWSFSNLGSQIQKKIKNFSKLNFKAIKKKNIPFVYSKSKSFLKISSNASGMKQNPTKQLQKISKIESKNSKARTTLETSCWMRRYLTRFGMIMNLKWV